MAYYEQYARHDIDCGHCGETHEGLEFEQVRDTEQWTAVCTRTGLQIIITIRAVNHELRQQLAKLIRQGKTVP